MKKMFSPRIYIIIIVHALVHIICAHSITKFEYSYIMTNKFVFYLLKHELHKTMKPIIPEPPSEVRLYLRTSEIYLHWWKNCDWWLSLEKVRIDTVVFSAIKGVNMIVKIFSFNIECHDVFPSHTCIFTNIFFIYIHNLPKHITKTHT